MWQVILERIKYFIQTIYKLKYNQMKYYLIHFTVNLMNINFL